MDKLIKSAFLDRKEKIPFGTDSYRVFDGQSDGIKNVYIDNFADHWLVSYNDVLPPLDLDDGPFKKSIWINGCTKIKVIYKLFIVNRKVI